MHRLCKTSETFLLVKGLAIHRRLLHQLIVNSLKDLSRCQSTDNIILAAECKYLQLLNNSRALLSFLRKQLSSVQ